MHFHIGNRFPEEGVVEAFCRERIHFDNPVLFIHSYSPHLAFVKKNTMVSSRLWDMHKFPFLARYQLRCPDIWSR